MKMAKTLKILIANGVNLDLLGRRQPQLYGSSTLKDVESLLRTVSVDYSKKNNVKIRLKFFQSNNEAEFLQELGRGYDGAVINAGAWTHTSLAIADRLVGLELPFVEVHISDVKKREKYRRFSFMAAHAQKVISGKGIDGYNIGLKMLLSVLKSRK
jgi:3-dehydroquinate dehydratase-2